MGRPGLTKHPKFKRLAASVDRACPGMGELVARGALELLWDTAYENGEDFIGDAITVEAVTGWKGEPGLLCKLLSEPIGTRKGFLEEVPDQPGCYRVHDLMDHAPDYVRKRRSREAERKQSAVTDPNLAAPDRSVTSQWQTTAAADQSTADFVRPPAPAPAPVCMRAPAHARDDIHDNTRDLVKDEDMALDRQRAFRVALGQKVGTTFNAVFGKDAGRLDALLDVHGVDRAVEECARIFAEQRDKKHKRVGLDYLLVCLHNLAPPPPKPKGLADLKRQFEAMYADDDAREAANANAGT